MPEGEMPEDMDSWFDFFSEPEKQQQPKALPATPREEGCFGSTMMSRLPVPVPSDLIATLQKPGPRYDRALKYMHQNITRLLGMNDEAMRLLEKLKNAERAAVRQALDDRSVFLDALHILSYFVVRPNKHVFPSEIAAMKARYGGNEILKNFIEGIEKALFKKSETPPVNIKRKLTFTALDRDGKKTRHSFDFEFVKRA